MKDKKCDENEKDLFVASKMMDGKFHEKVWTFIKAKNYHNMMQITYSMFVGIITSTSIIQLAW